MILLPTYACGEEPIDGAGIEDLAQALESHALAVHVCTLEDWPSTLQKVLKPGDVLLCQGAGDLSARVQQTMQAHSCVGV